MYVPLLRYYMFVVLRITNYNILIFMKRNLLFVVMSLFAMVALAQTKVKDHVEVMYFHGKQRCMTCMAIEKNAREVVEKDFANEKKSGKVVFKVVDISTPEGAKIAKDYRVSYSSLFLNSRRGGKQSRTDITRFAFKNARKHTDVFKKEIADKINELLK